MLKPTPELIALEARAAAIYARYARDGEPGTPLLEGTGPDGWTWALLEDGTYATYAPPAPAPNTGHGRRD